MRNVTVRRRAPAAVTFQRSATVNIVHTLLHAIGTTGIAGIIAQTSGPSSQSATASSFLTATISQVSGPSSQAAIGFFTFNAVITQTSGKSSQSAIGTMSLVATIAQASGKSSQAAVATQILTATIAQISGPSSQAATAYSSASAIIMQTSGPSSQAAVGTMTLTGVIAQTSGKSSQSATGTMNLIATIAQTSGKSSQLTYGNTTRIAQTSGASSQSATGTMTLTATIAQTSGKSSQSASASQGVVATIAQTSGKSSQASTAGVLWTPANLATLMNVIVDARTATWSGSNLSAISNTGSNGGAGSAFTGTVTKGTANNGVTPLNWSNASLAFAAQSFPGGKLVFLHVGRYQSAHGALWGLDWDANNGTFVHYPRDNGTSDEAVILASGAPFTGATGTVIRTAALSDSTLHVFTEVLGTAAGQQTATRDGTALTLAFDSPGTVPAEGPKTLNMGQSGTTYPNEFLLGDTFWSGIGAALSSADDLKFQGWGAWTFGPPGSTEDLVGKLPGGHPYKAFPPFA